MQGRPFSYLDTQLSRHNGPNFEQLPINRPRIPVNNNHRDGPGQMQIHTNKFAYTPNSFNPSPRQATRDEGRGFFSSPTRSVSGHLTRNLSATFDDVWSQPRLFYNSLARAEKQILINAIRFETSNLSPPIQANVLTQLNRVSNEIATLVGTALGIAVPEPESQFYHDTTTVNVRTFEDPNAAPLLKRLDSLTVGILATASDAASLAAAADLAGQLQTQLKVTPTVIAERLQEGVGATYSQSNGALYDAVIVTGAAASALITGAGNGIGAMASLFPAGRPRNIVADAFAYGKPVALFGAVEGADEAQVWAAVDAQAGPGVLTGSDAAALVAEMEGALLTYRFVDRFVVDDGVSA